MARTFAVALVCAALLVAGAAAAEEAPDAPPAPPTGQLATAAWFPKLGATAASALPAGEVVTVVVAARNEGKEAYRLAAVAGGVHTADFQHRVQNFTRSPIGEELAPGQEISVEYAIYLDPVLAGREYGVAIALIYAPKEAEGGPDAEAASAPLFSVAFNATVDVTEPPRLVDTEAIFMFAVLAGLAAIAAYFAYAAAAERFGLPAPAALLGAATQGGGGKGGGGAGAKGGAGAAAAARKAAAAKAARSADDDDEWVKGTSYDLMMAKRKRQGGAAAARVRAAAAE